MNRRACGPLLAAILLLAGAAMASAWQPRGAHPHDFFQPTVQLDAGERRDLRAGRTIVRTLRAEEPTHLYVFAMSAIDVATPQFLARMRHSAALWRGERVPATGTFSDPPVPADLRGLRLPPEDVDALPSCRPGSCSVKLSADEMNRLRAAIGRKPAAWRTAVQEEFRALVLDRVTAYRSGGLRALPATHDHGRPVEPQAAFAELLARTETLPATAPRLVQYLDRYPELPLPAGAEEHLYWIYTIETPRPTMQAVHAVIQPSPAPGVEALVVGRQIFATHYLDGLISITVLLQDPDDPSRRYLAYLNRSSIDNLGGFFSGLRRFFVERRIRGSARGAFEQMRGRIQGPPRDLLGLGDGAQPGGR